MIKLELWHYVTHVVELEQVIIEERLYLVQFLVLHKAPTHLLLSRQLFVSSSISTALLSDVCCLSRFEVYYIFSCASCSSSSQLIFAVLQGGGVSMIFLNQWKKNLCLILPSKTLCNCPMCVSSYTSGHILCAGYLKKAFLGATINRNGITGGL